MYIKILILFLLPILVFSSLVPISELKKNNYYYKPIKEDNIVLKKEIIDIFLNSKSYKVKVTSTLINKGKAKSILIGLPVVDDPGEMKLRLPLNYSILDNNKKKKITILGKGKYNFLMEEGTEELDTKDYYLGYITFPVKSKHYFKINEEKLIIQEYEQEYMIINDYTQVLALVYLEANKYWKASVSDIKVNIHFIGISLDNLYNRALYFEDNKSIKKRTSLIFDINSENYKIIDNNTISYNLKYNKHEPKNILLTLPSLIFKEIEASSTLKNKKNRYSINNIIDNNPHTAWVEGEKDFGKNVIIDLKLNTKYAVDTPEACGDEGCTDTNKSLTSKFIEICPDEEDDCIEGDLPDVTINDYLIKKIGIINGYAKSKKDFYNNNRVKKISIKYYSHIKNKKIKKEFILKDTDKLQYIEFKNPRYLNRFKIKILSVYKGKKYNDTCISELKVYPVKEKSLVTRE